MIAILKSLLHTIFGQCAGFSIDRTVDTNIQYFVTKKASNLINLIQKTCDFTRRLSRINFIFLVIFKLQTCYKGKKIWVSF